MHLKSFEITLKHIVVFTRIY